MPLLKPDLEFVFSLKATLGDAVVIGDTPDARAIELAFYLVT
jgi:hypothetical protein